MEGSGEGQDAGTGNINNFATVRSTENKNLPKFCLVWSTQNKRTEEGFQYGRMIKKKKNSMPVRKTPFTPPEKQQQHAASMTKKMLTHSARAD